MKKILIVLICYMIIFAGCGNDADSDNKSGSSDAPSGTAFKINNQSFTEITDVIWNNVNFANDLANNSIKTGTNVNKTVQPGTSYIFFKRKTNPIIARTNLIITIEKDEQIEFTFTDNTVIVEINNIINSGTLGSLTSSVVWWDDAEGQMQQYYESRYFVSYYSSSDKELPYPNYSIIDEPKNEKRSIAIGASDNALLHLRINLIKNAKVSFWYSNTHQNVPGASFSINGVVKRTWSNDLNWSFIEFDLEKGINDLIWQKKDGWSDDYDYFLTLDDILVYYTE